MDVAILDDSADLRSMLTMMLGLKLGVTCHGFASVLDLQAHRHDVLGAHLALIDINLGDGQPSGLDAYVWLRAEGFSKPVLFLTGHANGHPLVRRAEAIGIKVLAKPLDTTKLLQIVSELLTSDEGVR